MKLVKLKSGIECPDALVATTVLVLKDWLKSMPSAVYVYDVAMMSRDTSYKPFGDNGKAIADAGFMDGDRLHQSISEIIRCAVVGEGLDMSVVNPVAT